LFDNDCKAIYFFSLRAFPVAFSSIGAVISALVVPPGRSAQHDPVYTPSPILSSSTRGSEVLLASRTQLFRRPFAPFAGTAHFVALWVAINS
jgi:hypothetical protein